MTKPFDFSVPPEMRAMVENSMEQARKAFDTFMSAAEQATAGFEQNARAARAGAQGVAQKALAFAEQNATDSFDLAQKLLAARGIDEVVKLHADYARRQMQVLADQAKELGKTAAQAAPPETGHTGRKK